MNNLDKQYTELQADILYNGVRKGDRTGTGTLSVFGRQIRHKMSEGFPLLTTKKMAWNSMVVELLWFLRGDTNIQWLVQRGCNIWNGDAYKNYRSKAAHKFRYPNLSKDDFYPSDGVMDMDDFIEKIKTDDVFAKEWGDLGPIYGKQWRYWGGYKREHQKGILTKHKDEWRVMWSDLQSYGHGKHWIETPVVNCDDFELEEGQQVYVKFEIDGETFAHKAFIQEEPSFINGGLDQLKEAIKTLIENPDSRRIMVSAWNPPEVKEAVLPPCHYGFQFWARDLRWDEYDAIVKERVSNDIYNLHLQYRELIKETKEAIQIQNFEQAAELRDRRQVLQEQLEEHLEGIPSKAVSLMWNQRSVDTFLGLPFNIASYGLLLELIARQVNMVPDELIANLGDTHLYTNHLEQAREQIGREPYLLPKLKLDTKIDVLNIPDDIDISKIRVEGYKSHPRISAPLSN